MAHEPQPAVAGSRVSISPNVEPRKYGEQFAVTCSDLSVRYGGFTAARNVFFKVAEGQILGLLGPNGAEKTSVIRALTTILPAAGGRAFVAGADIRDPATVRSRIGVLPESSGYPGTQGALEYITYHGRLYGMTARMARDRGASLLAQVGLNARASDRIRTFSRGMRQRPGIARGLINNPRVLFLDEPTLGLDPAGKEDVLRDVRRVATEQGTTVILTSHLQDEIERVCDRVVIMSKSKVVADGTANELIRDAGTADTVIVHVPVERTEHAVAALTKFSRHGLARGVTGDQGEVRVQLANVEESTANHVASLIIDAGIPILALRLEGATLADAFRSLTTESKDDQHE